MDDDRRGKLAALRDAGIDPYPHAYEGVQPAQSIATAHADLEAGDETDSAYRVAGRLTGRREFGKAAFLDVTDRSGKIQVQARKDDLGDESFARITSLDLGDILGVDGTAFKSRRGELTLRTTDWKLLAKSLAPPPDKFHGLEDTETRYRRRELDLIANEEARELFILRSKVVSAIRRWLDGRGFLEVETPVLQPLYGGRAGAAVHHPPQRARPRPLPADRHRAVPQAADRGRAGARVRAGQGLPQRGPVAQAQPRVHDARVVRGLRRLRRHRGRAGGARRASWPAEVEYDGEIDFSPPVAARHAP